MIYDVRQTTTYAYASPAAYAQHVLRLVPIARERQRVTAAVLDIDPPPVRRREGREAGRAPSLALQTCMDVRAAGDAGRAGAGAAQSTRQSTNLR